MEQIVVLRHIRVDYSAYRILVLCIYLEILVTSKSSFTPVLPRFDGPFLGFLFLCRRRTTLLEKKCKKGTMVYFIYVFIARVISKNILNHAVRCLDVPLC